MHHTRVFTPAVAPRRRLPPPPCPPPPCLHPPSHQAPQGSGDQAPLQIWRAACVQHGAGAVAASRRKRSGALARCDGNLREPQDAHERKARDVYCLLRPALSACACMCGCMDAAPLATAQLAAHTLHLQRDSWHVGTPLSTACAEFSLSHSMRQRSCMTHGCVYLDAQTSIRVYATSCDPISTNILTCS
jgi:hypothetical protein